MLCRDSEHKLFGITGHGLVKLGLIIKTPEGYNVHDSIRNIVLSAIEGDGANMTIIDPRAPIT